jgi:hypothetical protein
VVIVVIRLTDTFLADSAYKFLTIGCFKSPGLIDADTVNYDQQPGAYYYIDDVSVEPYETSVAGIAIHGAAGIYPHPLVSSSEVLFDNPNADPFVFCLYNGLGQLVSRITNIRSNNFTVHRDDLASGVYYYRLSNNNNEHSYRGKLMIN